MNTDVFRLYAEIIELIEKPVSPNGEMGTNVAGLSFEQDSDEVMKTAYRAIIDVGLLDVEANHIESVDKDISFAGASSDMFVFDLGNNRKNYKVGDLLEFKPDYMGTVRILNSKYIDKKIRK
jgi:predicted amino acid racemase